MYPIYGNDSYASSSCLSGEALAWKLMNDLKKLKPVVEGGSKKLIALVNILEKEFLKLSKINAEKEINSTYVISLIEILLP